MSPPASSGRRSEEQTTRRSVLRAAGAASATGAIATLFAEDAAAERVVPESGVDRDDLFTIEREAAESTFPQSVVSGGPTPSGVILWTRIAEAAYEADADLGVEVATDDSFSGSAVVYRGVGDASDVDPANDYTVNVDLDGELDAGTEYAYRFVYDGDASRVGHCRTLPAADASPDEASFAVLSCNNYLDGYYGAFAYVAEEDVDFLLHLGDFVYEYAGEGQQPGRDVRLPSGHDEAWTLADFRHLYRTYREDDHLQRALEQHTLIHTWDDHEIVNNRWWNYEADAPETASHPKGDDPEFMRRLYVEGIKAYTEHVPARVEYHARDGGELAEDRLQEGFRLHRSFRFGDLAELFVTDERLYRSPPPEDAFGREQETATPTDDTEDPDRTMLGRNQRQWFVDGVVESDAQWKLWGNEVLNAALKTANTGELSLYLNYDAWDGYQFERKHLMGRFAGADVENFVALTGDMHTYVASYLLQDYESVRQTGHLPAPEDRVGVEFMTPAVTSDNLAAAGGLPADETEEAIDLAVRSQNPYVEWFNSSRWGYTVVRLTPDECWYTAYGVDRTVDSADAPKRLLRSYRVPAGENRIEEYRSSTLDTLTSDVDGFTRETTDGPDVYVSDDGTEADWE
jgi:alkaline phosphatase D